MPIFLCDILMNQLIFFSKSVNYSQKIIFLPQMKISKVYTKSLIAAMLLCSVGFNGVFGAFTGVSIDERTNKFSLKNLSALSKNYSLSYLRVGSYQYIGTQQVSQQKVGDTAVEVQSMMRVQRGNTTFVYPYKYKMQVPRFKTPAPPSFPLGSH